MQSIVVPLLLLLLLLPELKHAQAQRTLLNLGTRCTSTSDCETQLRAELCHYQHMTCLASYCRALPVPPCLSASHPQPCNSLNATCQVHQCVTDDHCDQRAYCDGHERCLSNRCVFETQPSYCRTLNETCLVSRRCSRKPPATRQPTGAPVEPPEPIATAAPTQRKVVVVQQSFHAADNTSNTTAPTEAPTAPPNVWQWGVILLGVMLFVFLVVLLVGMLTRNNGLTVVYSNGTSPPRYVY